jgi:hypothetical protein
MYNFPRKNEFPKWLEADLPKFESSIKAYKITNIGCECLETVINQISSEFKVDWNILLPYITGRFTSNSIDLIELFEFVKMLCTNRVFHLFTVNQENIVY